VFGCNVSAPRAWMRLSRACWLNWVVCVVARRGFTAVGSLSGKSGRSFSRFQEERSPRARDEPLLATSPSAPGSSPSDERPVPWFASVVLARHAPHHGPIRPSGAPAPKNQTPHPDRPTRMSLSQAPSHSTHVAVLSHGRAECRCNILELLEIPCNSLRHELMAKRPPSLSKSLIYLCK
jgi:hypothetical protein